MAYDYRKEMKKDIMNWFDEEVVFCYEGDKVTQVVISGDTYDEQVDWEEEMKDRMLYDDYITGGGTGSYTMSSCMAEEYVKDNEDLVYAVIDNYKYSGEVVASWFFNDEWDEVDVAIRQYLLGEVFEKTLEEVTINRSHGAWLDRNGGKTPTEEEPPEEPAELPPAEQTFTFSKSAKVIIEEIDPNLFDGYKYNVSVLISINGSGYTYNGEGIYCHTLKEAYEYMSHIEKNVCGR